MPFVGKYLLKVDSKFRIVIPALFRRAFGDEGQESCVATRGFEGYMMIFSPQGWADFQEKLSRLPSGPQKRKVIRRFSGDSAVLALDKQGRISLPRDFMAKYAITREVFLVGALETIEVWNPESYQDEISGADAAVDEMEHLL